MTTHSRVPDVSVIIVSFNTSAMLEACLRSLMTEPGDLTQEIFVVDNASTDGSCAMVREQFPDVALIANSENVGFACANNQGLARASGRYLVLLNSDTVILDQALVRLAAHMDAHAEIGMCAPMLVYPDLSPQQSAYPFPSLRGALALYTGIYGRFPVVARWLAPEWISAPIVQTHTVDWCSAACLMVSRRCFNEIGPLDDSFFMYSEDTDWCRHAADHGWQIVLLSEARVVHYLGGSQGSAAGQYDRRMRELAGTLLYLRKWHGPGYAIAYRELVRLCGLYRYWRRRHTAESPQELAYYLRLAFGRNG